MARERNRSESQIDELIRKHTEGRTFGVLGNPRVNVVLLTADLDAGRWRHQIAFGEYPVGGVP